jgi:catechol 2,3-dioxygenase-like lactoylglutathione lyase family enzyme
LTIVLDHTIVPARDKEESARFFGRIFGVEYQGSLSHFAPVRINETPTIDFDNWDTFRGFYFRDPNGHLLEVLMAGQGVAPDGRHSRRASRRKEAGGRGCPRGTEH